jgi:hypothetical protein
MYLLSSNCRWKVTKVMDFWKMSVIVNRTQENLQLKRYVVKLMLFFFIREEFLIFVMFAEYEKWYYLNVS